jgi:two-component system response regulator NreC
MAIETDQFRMMIVDDHPIFRASLRLLLEKHAFEVVAEANNAKEALDLVRKARPQIVMMDLELPGTDGITATRQLRRLAPNVKVIFLSAYDEEKDIAQAMTVAKADGYLLKSDAPDELINAVRAVAGGKRYLSPSVAPRLLIHLSDPGRFGDGEPKLTVREREVLRLVSQGATSKDIAQHLSISFKTAQAHRENLKRKLKVRTTAEMVRFAIHNKIVKLR